MSENHRGATVFTLGVSFVGVGIVSVKLSGWGYAIWEVHVPDHPLLYGALLGGLFLIPWLAVTLRVLDAALSTWAMQNIGVYVAEDEAKDTISREMNAALEAWFGWLLSTKVHAGGYGIISGGVAGVSITVLKIVLPAPYWMVIGAALGASLLVLVLVASAYWSRVSQKMAFGLSESLAETYPWMSHDADGHK